MTLYKYIRNNSNNNNARFAGSRDIWKSLCKEYNYNVIIFSIKIERFVILL